MIISPATASLSTLSPLGEKYVNPHASEAERIVKQRCQALGIQLPHLDEYNTMSAYLFPETGLQRLVAIGLLNNLLFYVDDVYDRHRADSADNTEEIYDIYVDSAQIFATGAKDLVKNDPVRRTAYELYLRFSVQAPRDWMPRLALGLMAHLKSRFTEPQDVDAHESLLERYKYVRDLDSGMEPTVDLIEFATGTALTAEQLSHPLVQEARFLVARYCNLSNDLFSFEKEVIRYGSDFNVISVLMKDGASFADAAGQVIDMLNGMSDRFIEIESQLPFYEDDLDNQVMAAYFAGLRHQFLAAYYWQFSTSRYRSPHSPFQELCAPMS